MLGNCTAWGWTGAAFGSGLAQEEKPLPGQSLRSQCDRHDFVLSEVGWLTPPQERCWGSGNHTFWAQKETRW